MVSDLIKNIRLKLLLLVLVPSVGLLYFASLSIYDKYHSYHNVLELEQDVNYITQASLLIKELQKERGLSIYYLSSGDSAAIRQKLQKQRRITDLSYRKFTEIFLPVREFGNEREIKVFLEHYKKLGQYRRKIDSRALSTLNILDFYSQLIDDLVLSIKILQPKFNDPQLQRKGIDLLNVLRISEIAGKERALISELLTRKTESGAASRYLISLDHAFHQATTEFQKEADLWDLQLYQRYVDDTVLEKLESVRREVIFKHRYDLIGPQEWWKLSTRYIDALFQVEKGILKHIDRLKAQRKSEASKSLIVGAIFWLILLLLLYMLYRRTVGIVETFGRLYEHSEAQKRLYQAFSEFTEYHKATDDDNILIKTLSTLLYRTGLFPYLWFSREEKQDLVPYVSEGIPLALLRQEFSKAKEDEQVASLLRAVKRVCHHNASEMFVPTSERRQFSTLFRDIGALGLFPVPYQGACRIALVLALPAHETFDRESIDLLQSIANALGEAFENNTRKRERRQIEEDLRIAATAFNAQEAITITDANGRILKVNDSFTRITGYSAQEAIGKNPNILKSGKHDRHFYNEMWDHIRKNGYWKGEIYNRRKNGEIYPEMLSISAVKDEEGNITHYVAHFFDITEVKKAQKTAEHRAQHDPLTELYNRQKLMDELQRIYHMGRSSGELNAFLFFDLDNFKHINDFHTHEVGDQVLMEIARRLKKVIYGEDVLARIAGDEFGMILCCLGHDKHAVINKVTIVVEKIKRLFSEPILIDDIPIETTFSIGIKLFPDDEKEWKEVIINADVAMYHAKRNGKDRYQFFNAKIDQESKHFLQIKNDFALALKRHELVLHYQPRVEISSGRIIGVEALIRWRMPDGTFRMPDDFLSVTQGNTLGYDLSEYVLDETIYQIEAWRAHHPGFDLLVSINLSGEQFNSPTFMQNLLERIRSEKPEIRRLLEFEIVEDVFVTDLDYTIEIIEEFRKLDIRFSIDDFGTGYSSINYLRRLPVETLKIDRVFISDLFKKDNDQIVRLIIETAKVFGMTTVAEGVESEEVLEQLKILGCDYYQGYLFSPPIPPEAIEKRWLEHQ